ncbi:MAG: hypothetical protein WCK82_05820 [Bacteroidota bacterium]
MKKTTYILGIISLFAMLFQSCTKENNSISATSEYYYLTASQLNQTPYFTNSKFDTISFSSNQGDTITFVKTKTDTSWYGERANSNPDDHSMNYYQIISNTYNTIKGSGSLETKHYKKENSFTDFVQININGLEFIFGDYQVGYSGYWNFKQRIQLKNKIFNDVIVVYPNDYDSLVAECYVNKDKGAFYFFDKTKNVELIINQ